ncbi:MAG: ATP-binding cassette domain-containing protein, partial [Dethiobacteria bacterium]|nr:ATP-binding cassette domain-containing protein [Dethiobacteria bacterium]
MIEEIIQLDDKTGSENQAILRLKNITKIYPGTVALKDVSLDIIKGEVHGIIGKNGAGKTTLVAIVAGLIKPTTGSIYIRNNEYRDLCRIVAKKEKISIV